ncbi:MAG: hypothetical protein HGA41_00235 [Syntrophaceae bacterium]|nr:hypothetical protein [Syntrophaceae bacterium]
MEFDDITTETPAAPVFARRIGNDMQYTIRARFDDVLGRHFERLIGTRQGMGGMPLNLATVGCIVLLGRRESEIQDSRSDDPGRYTRDTLLKEATDLGIGPDDSLESALENMIQKGYCESDSENRFFTRPPTITMTRLLDRIFPKMTGINFLAFIGQTMEEAVSGRTDTETAISRLDQTLHHYGVPFSKDMSAHKSASPSDCVTSKSDTAKHNAHINRENLLAELYNRDKTSRPGRPSLRVLSGGITQGHSEMKEIIPVEIGSIASISHTHGHNAEEVIGGNDSLLSDEALKNTGREEIMPACAEEMSLINGQEDREVSDNLVADNEHTPLLPEKNECALVSEEICGEDTTVSDDAIADRIAAFESNLAMKCPICRVNTLKEYTTAAGKVYYTCPSESCNFISWGKPHHTECGRCKNPFLVEVTDAAGKIILKCPRATCHHRQDLNTARKLVRKRLVRRRK